MNNFILNGFLRRIKVTAESRSLTLDGFIKNYSSVTSKPSHFSALRLIPYFIFRRFRNFDLLLRFIESGQYESQFVSFDTNLPEIELLFVTTRKDSGILPLSIEYAIKHSQNQISKISIIVPAKEVEYFSELLSTLQLNIEYQLISEDDQIDDESRALIKQKMQSRYGWTLQQFLTVSFCLQSTARGVLAVNSDTLILRDQTWLDPEGQQILMESYEFNVEYYRLIEKVNPKFLKLNTSHITHHMLFQPETLRRTIQFFGANSIQDYINIFMSAVNPEAASPLCVEFEPYANYLKQIEPKKIRLIRFCNIGVIRGDSDSISETISNFESSAKFNSISMHSWMA